MIRRVAIPKVSANVDEVVLTGWFKVEGEEISRGEALLEVTTDKAAFEIESPCHGRVRRILAREKSSVPVGFVVALVGGAKDALPDVSKHNRALIEKRRKAVGKTVRRKRRPAGKRIRVRATPAARRLARELDVDLAQVQQETGAKVENEDAVKQHAKEGAK